MWKDFIKCRFLRKNNKLNYVLKRNRAAIIWCEDDIAQCTRKARSDFCLIDSVNAAHTKVSICVFSTTAFVASFTGVNLHTNRDLAINRRENPTP